MRARRKQVCQEVAFLRVAAAHPPAPATLAPIRIRHHALDISLVRDRYDHRGVFDEFFHTELAHRICDDRPPRVAELGLHFVNVLADDVHHERRIAEQLLMAFDLLHELAILLGELLNFQPRQPLQLHRQNRVRLNARQKLIPPRDPPDKHFREKLDQGGSLVQTQCSRHQPRSRLRRIRRCLDQFDNRIDIPHRQHQRLDDVRPLPRLAQQVPRSTRDHLAPVEEVLLHHLLHRKRLRLLPHEGNIYNGIIALQRRMTIQLVDHDRLGDVPLALHHQTNRVLPVRFVADVADLVQPPVLDATRHPLRNRVLQNPERNLIHHDPKPASTHLFRVQLRPHHQRPSAPRVGVPNPRPAADHPTRRKIRTRDDLHDLLHRQIRIRNQRDQRVTDFSQVVRRDVRRHPHRNARRAVYQQVRKLRRQHLRLGPRVVIVRDEIDRLLVDILHHLHGRGRHPRLRIPHRRRWIAVDRAEVPLTVHQWIAQIERLTQPHQRRIHHPLSVRVIISGCVTRNLGALPVSTPRPQMQVVQRHEDPPLRRLQPVPHIRQRSRHDHAHRVAQVGLLHFFRDGLVVDRFVGSLCHTAPVRSRTNECSVTPSWVGSIGVPPVLFF